MGRKRAPKWLDAARRGARPGMDSFLSRVLGRAGVVPGGEVDRAIHSGRVDVNGEVVREPMHPVKAGDVVRFDTRPVLLDAPSLILMFHKPAGSVCAPRDLERGCTVHSQLLPLLPPTLANYVWHVVGRLDRATTGLLLVTNDAAVVQHVTSPEVGLTKRYVAHVEGPLDDSRLEPIRRGVVIEDGLVEPAQASVREPGVVELTIREGRHHQVRRMLNAVGLGVRSLHREAIGGLELDVAEGAFRLLSPDEMERALGLPVTQQRET